ncbi:hypothetical protein C0993_003633 [Termitomyces sp. T159_Od127]|nr:hypothetical protein C0993_003633 [Termitomyces sp. T159_Od127]
MNISEQGNICIDILKHNWSPALSLFKVMLSLSSLLTDPNPKDPLGNIHEKCAPRRSDGLLFTVPSIANQYTRNRKAHDAMARQWTELYARPKQPPAPSAGPILSAKAKGKQKASDVPNGSSLSSSSASTHAEPITIEDSDDERKRLPKRGTTKNAKRKREEKPEVNLVDDDDDVEVSGNVSASKKRAVGTGRIPRKSMSDGGSGRSQPLTQLGEIIVLDDD